MPPAELHPVLDDRERLIRLARGVELFNEGRYHAAHEPWEEIWRSTNPEPRDLFRGLVQITAALYHWHERKKAGPAARMLARGVALVDPFRPATLGLDLDGLLKQLEAWQAWLEKPSADEPPAPVLHFSSPGSSRHP